VLLRATDFSRETLAKFMGAHCDGPDAMRVNVRLAYMPGRAVTSRASSGCATGQCKSRSAFVSVVERKYA
jgi:hypothetical protein